MKILFTDEKGEVIGKSTHQLPDDPFEGRSMTGLIKPPLNLEQLIFLAETHPVHAAAIDQKTADVIGTGWEWSPTHDGAPEEQRDAVDKWFSGLSAGADHQTMHELLTDVWLDVETLNIGYIEVARDPNGVVQELYHVPGHTVRFDKSGKKLAQVRDNKKAWFARWGSLKEGEYVDRQTGRIGIDVPIGRRANELLVLRKSSRRSSWYGVPTYVSAIGWITLAIAVRDDNLFFFSNRREPRWAIILTNIEEDPNLEEDLRQAFTVDLAQPHRNVLIPIAGPGEVEFKKLSETGEEGSFEKLEIRCDSRILVAHRIPPERLGMNRVGPLGGNVSESSSRIYREAVISTAQALLSTRINRFIETEWPKTVGGSEVIDWKWAPIELDLSEETTDVETSTKLFTSNVITVNESRARLSIEPLEESDPRGDMLSSELKAHFGEPIDKSVEKEDPTAERIRRIDAEILQLLHPELADDTLSSVVL